MDYIKSYPFVSMTGEIPGYGEGIEDISRSGIDGHTFRKIGKRGKTFSILTKSTHSSESAAREAASDYVKLQGEFVTIDKGAMSYAQVLVHEVSCVVSPMAASTDDNRHLVTSQWTLQRAG